MRVRRAVLAAGIASAAAGAVAVPAQATFPGTDGRIGAYDLSGGGAYARGVSFDPDGGRRVVFESNLNDYSAAADGKRIAGVNYELDREADGYPVFVATAEGRSRTRLESIEPGTAAATPTSADAVAWGPSGDLVLVRGTELLLRDAATRRLRVVFDALDAGPGPAPDVSVFDPKVSSDGTTVVFLRRSLDPDTGQIQRYWTVGLDGRGAAPLPADVRSADWSPNERTLLVGYLVGDTTCRLAVLAPGGVRRPLPLRGSACPADAVFSPSGRRIAYVDVKTRRVETMDPSGARRRLVARDTLSPLTWMPGAPR